MTHRRRPTAMNRLFLTLLTAAMLAVLTNPGLTQERDRAKIPDIYKWNLADLYPTEAAWRDAKEKLRAQLPQLAQFHQKLLSSPRVLATALETKSALLKQLSRVYDFAGLLADEDTRIGQHEGMRQEMQRLWAAFEAQSAFIEPELLRTDKATLQKFISSEPRLEVYRF